MMKVRLRIEIAKIYMAPLLTSDYSEQQLIEEDGIRGRLKRGDERWK